MHHKISISGERPGYFFFFPFFPFCQEKKQYPECKQLHQKQQQQQNDIFDSCVKENTQLEIKMNVLIYKY